MNDGIVHVVNGDSVAGTMEEADMPGDIRVYADALDQGPVLATDDDAFRSTRAAFWAEHEGERDAATIAAELAKWDAGVDSAIDQDEIVLWYEHDLFCQLALVRLLSRIGKRPRKAQLSMVSIDRHPDIPDFKGMGQLEAHQLAALWPRRTPIAKDILDEAAAAWIAITSPDPRAILFVAKRIKALPFLAPALERHLEELPDTGTGLGRTERQILAAVARGLVTVKALMEELSSIDPRYLATDQLVLTTLRTLASIGLVEADIATMRPGPDAQGAAAITAAGREVLAGKLDRVAALGIDTWRGGVRLAGKGPVWRWDQTERRTVLA
jgi:hypothetical protein